MKVYLKILSFLTPLIALAISFGLTTFILILIDRDPVETFTLMFDYGTTGKSIISILNRSIPLYISAVAVAVGFKMGMFNIGVEGQYILGALIAAQVGAVLILPRPLHVLTIFIVAAVVSGIWAGISGYLKVKKGVHEVISTIMLNYIGAGIVAYLLANIFFEKEQLKTRQEKKHSDALGHAWSHRQNAASQTNGIGHLSLHINVAKLCECKR